MKLLSINAIERATGYPAAFCMPTGRGKKLNSEFRIPNSEFHKKRAPEGALFLHLD